MCSGMSESSIFTTMKELLANGLIWRMNAIPVNLNGGLISEQRVGIEAET